LRNLTKMKRSLIHNYRTLELQMGWLRLNLVKLMGRNVLETKPQVQLSQFDFVIDVHGRPSVGSVRPIRSFGFHVYF